ncbi:MAG: hypothetical protein HY247_08430 [archaeon]|nr:MAG: hypothetical protein HY247_08430 [archaeon]
MSPRTKSKPVGNEGAMAALDDYFYKAFLAKMSERSIDIGGLKKLADRCSTDSPPAGGPAGAARENLQD